MIPGERMNIETELPDEVIAELEAGRKLSAIKLLRTRQGLDLKDAKEIVEAYLEDHPTVSAHQVPQTDSGIGRIIILIIGVGVIYAIYRYFS